jgi:hypothetical protein
MTGHVDWDVAAELSLLSMTTGAHLSDPELKQKKGVAIRPELGFEL